MCTLKSLMVDNRAFLSDDSEAVSFSLCVSQQTWLPWISLLLLPRSVSHIPRYPAGTAADAAHSFHLGGAIPRCPAKYATYINGRAFSLETFPARARRNTQNARIWDERVFAGYRSTPFIVRASLPQIQLSLVTARRFARAIFIVFARHFAEIVRVIYRPPW